MLKKVRRFFFLWLRSSLLRICLRCVSMVCAERCSSAGYFLGGFSLLYEVCHLDFCRSEHLHLHACLLGKRRRDFPEVCRGDFKIGALRLGKPCGADFFKVGHNQVIDVGEQPAAHFGPVVAARLQKHLQGDIAFLQRGGALLHLRSSSSWASCSSRSVRLCSVISTADGDGAAGPAPPVSSSESVTSMGTAQPRRRGRNTFRSAPYPAAYSSLV